MNKFIQGSVWWYSRPKTDSCLTYGKHPCVIISSNSWNEVSGSVIVIPGTSDPCNGTLKEPRFQLSSTEGYFFPTQITTISKHSLFGFEGILPSDQFTTLIKCLSDLVSPSFNIDTLNIRDPKSWGPQKPSISFEHHEASTIVVNKPLNRRTWTIGAKNEFIRDFNSMSQEEVARKYDLGSIYTVRKYYKMFSQDLGGTDGPTEINSRSTRRPGYSRK